MTTPSRHHNARVEREELLSHLIALSDKPLTALSFVWLILTVIAFTHGLDPFWHAVSNTIWGIVAIDFLLKCLVAPHRGQYLRENWFTGLSIFLPALLVLRAMMFILVLGAASGGSALSLARTLAALNRAMRGMRRFFGRRKFGYVVALTAIVTLIGAAGMFAFENPAALQRAGVTNTVQQGSGLPSYGRAIWWTAMLMTTLGSDYWLQTTGGRALCFLLALYSFVIFGYITASIASLFLGQDSGVTTAQGRVGRDTDVSQRP